MSTDTQTVQVTLTLPKDVYERAAEWAQSEEQQLTELLSSLIAEGLMELDSPRAAFERAAASYRARLAREGKLDQSPDEVLQELRDLREQVARELYP
jgi:hypothetical protein